MKISDKRQRCTIAVTGANGYVGKALLRRAKLADLSTLALSRRAVVGADQWMRYSLEEAVSGLQDVSFLVHLAYDAAGSMDAESEMLALERLATACASADVRWMFVSSQSAKSPIAEYGRRKQALEAVALRHGARIVRPGLVYGGRRPSGLAGRLNRLALLPALPSLGKEVKVQPVHVNDLADGILAALTSLTAPPILEFGGQPITLDRFIGALADGKRGRRPVHIIFPRSLFVFAASLAGPQLRGSLKQMFQLPALADDMARFNLSHMPLRVGALRSDRPSLRALLTEGRCLARAIGLPTWTAPMERRYASTIIRRGGHALDMQPRDIERASRAIAARRISTNTMQELAARLNLAAAIFEANPVGAARLMRFQRSNPLITLTRLTLAGAREAILRVRGNIDALFFR